MALPLYRPGSPLIALLAMSHVASGSRSEKTPVVAHPPPRHFPALAGRNEPCPCGSGSKYKRCCSGKPLNQRGVISQ